MKRVFAFFIDHMILAYILIVAVFCFVDSDSGFVEDWVVWFFVISGFLSYLGYFFVCDYFFQGMTPGKKLLGVRMQWCQGNGIGKLREVIMHVVLKTAMVFVWPFALIGYLSSKAKMPYDQRLGILYLADESKNQPGWRSAVRIVAVIAAFYMVFVLSLSLIMQKVSGNEYYSFGEEKIASVSSVLGRQKLVGYSSSGHSSRRKITYQYRVDDGMEAVNRYAQYLLQNEGFSRADGDLAVFKREGTGDTWDVTVELITDAKYLQVTLIYER